MDTKEAEIGPDCRTKYNDQLGGTTSTGRHDFNWAARLQLDLDYLKPARQPDGKLQQLQQK